MDPSMSMALVVGIPVVAVVCSDSDSNSDSSDHHHQRPTPVLQLQLHGRRSANYEPTTWDYGSISRCPQLLPLGAQQDQEEGAVNHLQLLVATSDTDSISTFKDSVRRLLSVMMLQEQEEDDTRNSGRVIRTIHQLQSLGIAYHFEQEIRGILMSIHQLQHHGRQSLDLPSAALLFTMLRQLGIPASTDMLMNALLREEGDKITPDSDALLAVYQASYLAFPGETWLDQARAFAVGKLAARDDDSDSTHLPSWPLHWTSPRLQAMWSLKDDDRNNNRVAHAAVDPAILQLAQVDFNLVQAVHRRELAEVTRWWKESRLVGESSCSFARDRVVECFFCAACIAPEPRLAECREVLAKTGALVVHLDDIYDVYGTLDELQAFTDAIASWEHCDCDCDDDDDDDDDTLPDYMKAMYSAIRTTSVAAADRVLQKHGYDMLPLYKKAWHDLCKAFLVEAQWQQQGHMPSFAEYVSNAWVTSTGPLLLLHALPAAGIPITQTQSNGDGNGDAAGIDYPRLVELSSTIFRLCNDCASHKAESERGDAPSSIACCMAEPWCAGEEQARAAIQGVIAETWKLLNREVVAASGSGGNDPSCSSSAADTESLTTMAKLCLNLARITHCIYQDGDGITSPTHRMKQMVNDLLFNPIDLKKKNYS